MHSRATDRRSASKCQGKWPDQTLDQAFGLPEVLVAVSTSRLSCKRAGENANIDAGLGFIWRISDEMPEVPARKHCYGEVLRGMCCSAAPNLCQLWKPGIAHSQVLPPMWPSPKARCGRSPLCLAQELHTPASRRQDSHLQGSPRG